MLPRTDTDVEQPQPQKHEKSSSILLLHKVTKKSLDADFLVTASQSDEEVHTHFFVTSRQALIFFLELRSNLLSIVQHPFWEIYEHFLARKDSYSSTGKNFRQLITLFSLRRRVIGVYDAVALCDKGIDVWAYLHSRLFLLIGAIPKFRYESISVIYKFMKVLPVGTLNWYYERSITIYAAILRWNREVRCLHA